MGLLSSGSKSGKLKLKWFLVEPSPFQLLSLEDQDRLTHQFSQMLNSLNVMAVYVKGISDTYEYEGVQYPINVSKFFVGTTADQIGFFNGRPVEGDPLAERPRVIYEYKDKVKLSNNMFAKTFVAYDFPDYLPDGFLYEYTGLVSEIFILFKQVEQTRAIKMVTNAKLRAESLLSGRANPEVIRKVQKLRELSNLIGGSVKLYETYLFMVVTGSTPEELAEREARVRQIAEARILSLDAPKYVQRDIYEFKTTVSGLLSVSLEKIYVDSLSASSFYPFISEDLIDENGIFLGISGSNSPVVFNPYMRNNYNIVILGESGSGKSMTTKIFLKRLRKRLSIGINGIDPENEYVKDVVAKELGATPVIIKPGQKLGLDLMKFVREGLIDPTDAAELLGDLYFVPQELRPKLRRVFSSSSAETIFQFVDELREAKMEDLLKYLDAIDSPPDSYVFDGTPVDISGNVVFGIKELRNQRLKVVVSSLLTLLLQRKMLSGKQLLFVDEAWIFSEYPSVLNMFQEVARRGRKYGDIFMYVTQRPWDVYSTPEGRTILEQAATAILLRQRAAATEVLQKAYNLSQAEIEYLLNANPGHGIIRAGNYKVTIHILPTREELQTFSTSPVTA